MSDNQNLDQTFDEIDRQYRGAFYTPKIWVDEGHKEIEKYLGSTWRDDYLVWDCCAGSGNLTRDYAFKDLMLSSIDDREVEVLNEEQGDSALIFKYDFLSNDFSSLPSEVVERLETASREDKGLLFLINPPYATSSKMGAKGGSKTGVTLSPVKEQMVEAKIGKASNNLYAQFLFQCNMITSRYDFNKRSVCSFTPISYMESGSYHNFRVKWYERWEYNGGFLFKASHFEGLSDQWGISFVVWTEGFTDLEGEMKISIRDIVEE